MPVDGAGLRLAYLWGGVATYEPGDTFGPRTLRDYELVWLLEGDAVYEHDGSSVRAPAGAVILGKPETLERYAWDRSRRTRHAYFHFGLEAAPAEWGPPSGWPVLRPGGVEDAVRPLFRRVLDRWGQRTHGSTVRPPGGVTRLVAALLEEFISGAEARPGGASRPLPEAVLRALGWMESEAARQRSEPATLGDAAAAASVSPSQLVRLFRQSVGVTPMRAMQLVRLERAMGLLHRSNLGVGEVAHRCGFASPFHFSRVFARVYGESPTAMRKRFAAGGPRPPAPLPLDAALPRQW